MYSYFDIKTNAFSIERENLYPDLFMYEKLFQPPDWKIERGVGKSDTTFSNPSIINLPLATLITLLLLS